MKARVVSNWPADTVDVWLYRGPLPGGTIDVLELEPPRHTGEIAGGAGRWRATDAELGDAGPPTLTLPTIALEALIEAASNLTPPNREQAAALADARKVRDELLSLVGETIRAVHRIP